MLKKTLKTFKANVIPSILQMKKQRHRESMACAGDHTAGHEQDQKWN